MLSLDVEIAVQRLSSWATNYVCSRCIGIMCKHCKGGRDSEDIAKNGNFALVHILGRYLTASLSFTWSQYNIFHIFTIFINQLVHLKVHIVHICFPVKILDFGSWCSFIFQRIATAAFILADLLHLIVVLYIFLAFSGKEKIQTTVSRICKTI